MPIVFEEISGEVAPERGGEGAEPAAPAPQPEADPAEIVRRELQLSRERERRLVAD